MTVRRIVALLVALATLSVACPAQAATPRTSLSAIEPDVMCVTCGTALNISQAPSADRERAFIQRLIAQGLTEQQVKDELVRQYGRAVLATPRSPLAWIVPVGLALLAIAVIAFSIVRWRRRTPAAGPAAAAGDPAGPPPGPGLDPADAARLDRDMAAFDR